MIAIHSTASLVEIEDSLEKLSAKSADELQLPSNMRFGGVFGIPAAIIQLVVKWARLQENASLRLYDNQLKSLSGTPHGMVALYCAKRVIASPSLPPLTPHEALKFVAERVSAMQSMRYSQTSGGRGISLICFAGAKNEFITPFYPHDTGEALRSRANFRTLAREMLSAFAPEAGRRLNQHDLDNLGLLIYELFSNTHEHARFDTDGNRLKPSVRGVVMTYIPDMYKQIGMSGEGDFTNGDGKLAFYLQRGTLGSSETAAADKSVRLSRAYLELTVFDTGPGLVRHWLSHHGESQDISSLNIDDELRVVQKCFMERMTTKDTRASGHGLPSVLESLRQLKAYLRLRTGRLSLVQDFSKKNYAGFALEHWREDRRTLEDTVGASYSIVIPLGGERL